MAFSTDFHPKIDPAGKPSPSGNQPVDHPGENGDKTVIATPLFDWGAVEALGSGAVLSGSRSSSESDLIQILEARRGTGRDEYAVAAMWHAMGEAP